MRIFSALYIKILDWARHQHAPYYLYSLSFAESSFFPIPPDFMLAPMALAKPHFAWTYATWTTIASVLGGVFGYFIGAWAFGFIHPYIVQMGYEASYQHIVYWFGEWNFWVMLIAGFAPIPYKLFTIAAGATHIDLLPFILGSVLGRGGRFFLVALLIRWGGERMERLLMRYVEWLGWLFVVVLLVLLTVSLSGCSTFGGFAPVAEGWRQHLKAPVIYTVQHNDTLYSISHNHGLDYHRVARENKILEPGYKIEPGQQLRLTPEGMPETAPQPVPEFVPAPKVADAVVVAPIPVSPLSISSSLAPPQAQPVVEPVTTIPSVDKEKPKVIVRSVKTVNKANIDWAWPVMEKCKPTTHFTAGSLNKGIDIPGKKGDSILAAAPGRVVYAGSGLHGYGLLIIIRHSNQYLSAYAHNEKLFVKEGQSVKVGEVVAVMGDTDAKGAILHFEIRRAGRPVNPLSYLPH